MLCNEGQPGCVTVETIDTAECIRDILVVIIATYSIRKCMVVVVEGRVDGHICRFIHSKDVLVFITDGKRQGNWQNMCGGCVFGSVSTKEIAQAAKEQAGLDLDKKKMQLGESIKALGTYEIPVKLHPKVTATLRVQVVEE